MIIAIDYDQCFTEDVPLWCSFINLAQQGGHTVYLVTARYYSGERVPWYPANVQIIYTNRKAKLPLLRDGFGIEVDIWIDDRPEFIHNDHGNLLKWTEEEQQAWAEDNPNYAALEARRHERSK